MRSKAEKRTVFVARGLTAIENRPLFNFRFLAYADAGHYRQEK
jgi:hypothetical protein